jgi:ATP-dependent DNA helicase 2 subunit 1
LADERIILTKEDITKIKRLRKPGITLVGFKPKKLIKPYHNLRPSYFLYPD